MKTIVFFSHSSGFGGAEKYLLELASVLQKDHLIIVILPEHGILNDKLLTLGVQTHIYAYSWWLNPKHPLITRWNRYTKTWLQALWISPKIRALGPDIVVTNTSAIAIGAIVARIIGISHIWNIHEFGTLDHGLFFDLGLQPTYKRIRHWSKAIIVNSQSVFQFVENLIGNTKDIYTVYNACITDTQSIQEQRASQLFCIGSIHPGKGQLTLIETLFHIKKSGIHTTLTYIGPTSDSLYLEEIHKEINRYKLNKFVTFVGSHPEPTSLLSSGDILIVPSRHEAFGRITVEALKQGLLVIATRTGGSTEIITDHDNGLLYDPENSEDLKNKILWGLQQSNERTRMRQRALETSKKFNIENTQKQFNCVLNAVFTR